MDIELEIEIVKLDAILKSSAFTKKIGNEFKFLY